MVTWRWLRHLRTVVISSMVALVVAPGVADAHTEFDYSLPADGASVGFPVDEITVAFTSPVSLVGNGFAVLDSQNTELAPFAVTDDDTVFRLQLDPPLTGGTVAVRYEVRAEDGHVLAGNFVFDVDAPTPSTAPPTTTSTTTSTATTSPTTATPTDSPTTPTAAVTTPPTGATITRASGDTLGGQVDKADDDGSGSGSVLAVAAVVAFAVGGFLILRSRTSR